VSIVQSLGLADILAEHSRRWSNRPATVDGPVRQTYAELQARVVRLSNALLARGIGKDDRILWLGQNSWRLLETILAAARLGAMVCPANWRQSPAELALVIEDCDSKLVIWQEAEIGGPVVEARKLKPSAALWLRHDGDSEYEAFLASGSTEDLENEVDPSTPVLMVYTAAFGGRPAGALISHTALIAQSLVYGPARGITQDYRYLNVGPLFHVATLIDLFATFVMGGLNVFMPRNDPEEVCRLIEAERITGAFVIGPAAEQLAQANKDRRWDLSSLVALGGSPEWNAMVTVDSSPWGKRPYGFGQTESLGYATYALMGGQGAMGYAAPIVRLRILDEAGNEVANGTVGEIALRGPTISPGYWNRPGLTRQRQYDGWHRTNDLGRREADGSLTFIGPKGQLIKSAAENIYPAEVEACIRQHPAVKDVGVIGTPDPKWVQSVKAIVVLKDGEAASAEDIVEHCRARIASYKKPKHVVFVDAIPRAGFAIDYARLNAEHGGGGYPGEAT
jgi:long-chain acyl-CoA synthetase